MIPSSVKRHPNASGWQGRYDRTRVVVSFESVKFNGAFPDDAVRIATPIADAFMGLQTVPVGAVVGFQQQSGIEPRYQDGVADRRLTSEDLWIRFAWAKNPEMFELAVSQYGFPRPIPQASNNLLSTQASGFRWSEHAINRWVAAKRIELEQLEQLVA